MVAAINKALPVQFGSYAVVDVGASKKYLGNMRIELRNKQHKLIKQFEPTTVVDKPFKSAKDFTTGFAIRLTDAFLAKQAVLKNDPIDAIIGVVPGAVYFKNNAFEVSSVGNLQTKAGQVLQKINMQNMFNALESGQAKPLMVEDVKQLYANDMVGGAAYVANKMFGSQAAMKRFNVKPGEQLFLVMTGGGLGVCQVIHHPAVEGFNQEHIELKPTEKGHIVQNSGDKPIEKKGASVHALIDNFTNNLYALDMTRLGGLEVKNDIARFREELNDSENLVGEGKFRTNRGEIVTDYQQAIKDFPNLSKQAYVVAASSAIDDYLDALVFFIASERFAFNSKIVLTGKVVGGVNNFLNNPEFLNNKLEQEIDELNNIEDKNLSALIGNHDADAVLAKLLVKRMWDYYSSGHAQGMTMGMNELTPFKIITNFPLNSNADGGPMLKGAVANGLSGSPNSVIFKPNWRLNTIV